MSTYAASEIANSPHPRDWGRAMSVAMDHLLDQARAGGYEVQGQTLFGQRMQLTITEIPNGVRITLQWTPEGAQAEPPREPALA